MKQDRNNFISLILTKLELSKSFHQRIAFTITSKLILNHITLNFYIRKRFDKVYLYIRPVDKMGVINRHNYYRDIKTLSPKLEIVSKKGHYTGFLIEYNFDNKDDLIYLLKLIAFLAHPSDFEITNHNSWISLKNNIQSSKTPIHFKITHATIQKLQYYDLRIILEKYVKKYNNKLNNFNINNNSS